MYFTAANVTIDKRMEEGKTLLFPITDPDYREKAEKFAKQIRSYCYEAFKIENKEKVLAGLAVPR